MTEFAASRFPALQPQEPAPQPRAVRVRQAFTLPLPLGEMGLLLIALCLLLPA